ncbi:MAG: hypothetical protein AWU59_715 [Methanolobus sp. T82-4]|jgi:hypothetical protein|nr:MAG: hypothetical protein AWU59_715 [Methanolobus sp. T82-4]
MDPDLSRQIDLKIDRVNALSVISGYYLVIGGGKIGSKFVEYAKDHDLPFVLVIDIDCEAPVSKLGKVLEDRKDLADILDSLNTDTYLRASSLPEENRATQKTEIYFYCMDSKDIPSLLGYGIPEYIIPAVPSHAAVDIIADFVNLDMDTDLIREVSMDKADRDRLDVFQSIVSKFPENIVAGTFPEHGAIFLSYARPGELCPDNCRGQENYCYNFKREKPKTITSYAREITQGRPGWVFESRQMGPGIGGIQGRDLKENLISFMKYVNQLECLLLNTDLENRLPFIATTCNCHGILNLLQIDDIS